MSHEDRHRKGCRMSFAAGAGAVALTAGALISVLIAWGAALWAPLAQRVGPQPGQVSFHPTHELRGPASQEIIRRGIGLTSTHYLWFVESVDMAPSDRPRISVSAGDRRWGQFDMTVYEAGWPLRILRAVDLANQVERGPDGAPLRQRGILTAGVKDAEKHLPAALQVHAGRMLPLRPIWGALIASTFLYGGLPILLLCGGVWLRQHRRLRRGLCLGCAYPLGAALRCPECGAPAPTLSAQLSSKEVLA